MKNKRNKLLFIAQNIPVPGRISSNKIIYTIAEKLQSSYEIDFFFPKQRVPWGIHFFKKHRPLYQLNDWVYNGLNVHVIPYIHLPGWSFTYWLFNRLPGRAKLLFEQGDYDLIHAHYGMPDGYIAYLLSKRYDVPYVLTLRNHDVRHLNTLKSNNKDYHKYIKVLQTASRVLVTNAALQDYFSKYGVSAEIMPHGIERSEIVKSILVKNDTIIRIACVSHYVSTKNIEWVIDAVLQYKGDKEIELSVAGNMSSLPEKYFAIKDSRINILGKQSYSNVMNLLESSDIFAMPSEFETFGLVYLEAAAKRNAIIGYNGQGVWGVFNDKEEMFFAKDFNDFKKKLHLLIEDEAICTKLQKSALEKAQTLSWEKVCDMYNSIYSLLE